MTETPHNAFPRAFTRRCMKNAIYANVVATVITVSGAIPWSVHQGDTKWIADVFVVGTIIVVAFFFISIPVILAGLAFVALSGWVVSVVVRFFAINGKNRRSQVLATYQITMTVVLPLPALWFVFVHGVAMHPVALIYAGVVAAIGALTVRSIDRSLVPATHH